MEEGIQIFHCYDAERVNNIFKPYLFLDFETCSDVCGGDLAFFWSTCCNWLKI